MVAMTLFLAVTADKYELPLYVATSAAEMARWQGVSVNAIHTAVYRYIHGAHRRKQLHPQFGVRFCRVEVDDDEE